MRRRVVTHRAEADLREIWRWSFDRFGEAQADRYLDELDEGLWKCAADPEKGRYRGELRRGIWSRRIRKHVAFYSFTEEELVVHRVLHAGMDSDRHLPARQAD